MKILERLVQKIKRTPVTHWEYFSPPITTSQEKLAQAKRLQRAISPVHGRTLGRRVALEEFAHASGDKDKTGAYLVRRNILGQVLDAAYYQLGPNRTARERYKISTAGMHKGLISQHDVLVALDACSNDKTLQFEPVMKAYIRTLKIINPSIAKQVDDEKLRIK